MVERELINVPEWVSIHDAAVGPGGQYWCLTRLRFEDEDESGGRHHIYFEEPHDPAVRALVRTGDFTFPIPLEKPHGEPAGNHPMAGIPNVYSVEMEGAASDRVEGLQMRGNRHVNYLLTWELRTREGGEEGGEEGGGETEPSATLDAHLLQRGEAEQRIQFNPGASLQQAIFRDGFVPNSPEFGANFEGTSYVAQRAERLSDGAVRVYFCEAGDFANVRVVERA